ncbi:MAG: efflux RND transporter periplasmic adaptor subunit [Bacteroidota bacterium]|nr:efflux RND transporter periplasmic adaptor subunit [Bacteroidota bacterium]
MKTNIKYILTGIAIAFALWSCNKEEAATQETEVPHAHEENTVELTQKQSQLTGIQLGYIEKRELSGSIKVNGKLEVPPQQKVTISIAYGGFLKNTELLEGMHVQKGQIIAELEHPDYIQFQQDYILLRSQLEFEEANFKREKELSEENVTALKTFQQTKADYTSAKAKVAALEQKLRLLHLNPDKIAEGNIFPTIKIYAPISGYVTQVNSNIGAFVPSGSELFRIIDSKHLHVELTVFEKDLTSVKVGQKIRFILGDEQKERFANVYLIGREISPERAVRIHGHLLNEDDNLIAGTYVKAWIETGKEKTNTLPEKAIVQADNRDYIFVLHEHEEKETQKSGKNTEAEHTEYQKVEITKGIVSDGFVEVVLPDSFNMKSKVVVNGAYDLLSKMGVGEEEGHAH